jgi:hypothetical protein
MPLERTETAGQLIASGTTTYRQNVTLAAATTILTRQVAVLGLPRIFFWLRHTTTAAGVGVSVIPQFSVADVVVAGVSAPEFLDFSAPVVLPFNVPVLLNFLLPAKFIRLSITTTAAAGGQIIQFAYGANQ